MGDNGEMGDPYSSRAGAKELSDHAPARPRSAMESHALFGPSCVRRQRWPATVAQARRFDATYNAQSASFVALTVAVDHA
jgi:hypothetical protein